MIVARRDMRGAIVQDNRGLYACNAMLPWRKETGIDRRFMAPRKQVVATCNGARARSS